ncbi:unnamed protein product [Periconia digitata]|uniref:MOSC domain-containing protein n=1 Tax=Periconia digitata TaxID=1303443 RepID=A0A9W4UI30_9PLEO|nr:unnamed protein product [Periconia digitata]
MSTSQLYWAVGAIALALLYQLYSYTRLSSHHSQKPLKISQILVYPIKSLRPTQLTSALATQYGFLHDRVFMLLKVTPDGRENMAISKFPEMSRFLTSMHLDESGNGFVKVTFHLVGNSNHLRTLEIPLSPDVENLQDIEINLEGSPTKALQMQDTVNKWFSECFGYEVVMAFLGDNKRGTRFQDMLAPAPAPNTWLPSILLKKPASPQSKSLTFADCAPYLVVSATSLDDVSSRLPDGQEMDVTKFRPNIVLSGASKAWEEDYWRCIKIWDTELVMMHNCVRCKSINVDYETGDFGTGDSGQVLKKLQKDRRVDTGAKWSPVFGRYSFWSSNNKSAVQKLRVADEVRVIEVNEQRTTWSKMPVS